MKKTLLFIAVLLLCLVELKAKTVTTITTLQEEGIYVDLLDLSSSDIDENDVVTIYLNFLSTEGCALGISAKYSNTNGLEADGAMSIGTGDNPQWLWVANGAESYALTLTSGDITKITNSGHLYICTGDKTKMTITKITKTRYTTENETDIIVSWTGQVDLNWGNSAVNVDALKTIANAKVGDVFRITYSSATASNRIWIVNANGWNDLDVQKSGQFNDLTDTSGTLEFEIPNASILEIVQNYGIVISGANATVTKVELLTYASSYDAVAISIGSDQIATYSHSSKNVQISSCDGIRAYYASNATDGVVTLTELDCVPANQGVMVTGDEGIYTVPVGDTGWTDISSSNLLKPTGNDSKSVTASGNGIYHYIFAKNSSGQIGFYELRSSAHTLAAHKAYLETTTNITPTTSAPLMLIFEGGADDGTTYIEQIGGNEINDNNYYDLSGRRVAQPTRGLYIVNGKKVFIK